MLALLLEVKPQNTKQSMVATATSIKEKVWAGETVQTLFWCYISDQKAAEFVFLC